MPGPLEGRLAVSPKLTCSHRMTSRCCPGGTVGVQPRDVTAHVRTRTRARGITAALSKAAGRWERPGAHPLMNSMQAAVQPTDHCRQATAWTSPERIAHRARSQMQKATCSVIHVQETFRTGSSIEAGSLPRAVGAGGGWQ